MNSITIASKGFVLGLISRVSRVQVSPLTFLAIACHSCNLDVPNLAIPLKNWLSVVLNQIIPQLAIALSMTFQ